MFKKFTILFLVLLLTISFISCKGNRQTDESSSEELLASTVTAADETMPETTHDEAVSTASAKPPVNLPGKIAVITEPKWGDGISKLSSGISLLQEKYGEDDILHYFWPTWPDDDKQKIIDEIIADEWIKVLVIADDGREIDTAVKIMREKRDDLFLIYAEHKGAQSEIAYRLDTDLSKNAIVADLVLTTDATNAFKNFLAQAKKMGAKTLVCLTDAYGVINANYTSDREKECEDAGLKFATADFPFGLCGSDTNNAVNEIFPEIYKKHGKDIVITGLEEFRLFSTSIGAKTFFASSGYYWADVIFSSVPAINEMGAYYDPKNIAYKHEEMRKYLDENNMLGRVSLYPVTLPPLFTHTAVEYGIKWMKGEVSEEADIIVLEQIMTDFITEYAKIDNAGVYLNPIKIKNTDYPNYIGFSMDHLLYK